MLELKMKMKISDLIPSTLILSDELRQQIRSNFTVTDGIRKTLPALAALYDQGVREITLTADMTHVTFVENPNA